MPGPQFWSGRRVAMTGHTGFKGTWLASWLAELGAEVTGIGQPPATEPSLFAASGLTARIHSRIADVRSRELLARHLREAQPEVLFHLAAQALVTASLDDPVTTLQTNILGVVNLLEAARHLPSLKAVVVITSDKCYLRPDRRCAEGDQLGGHDPYSASKACAEIVTHAYRSCYFPPDAGVGVATVRAGHVIGGGGWGGDVSAAATSRPAASCPIWSAPLPLVSPRSCATPAGSGPGSTCSTRWPATSFSPSASRPTRPRSRPPGTSARMRA